MASYHHLLEHTKPRFESPAKVFAKLKSKVQREGMCANEGIFTGKDPLCNIRDKHGAESKSPKKRTENIWTGELKENQRFSSYRNEALAVTLSPISSPPKTFGYSYSDISSKPAEFIHPATERGHGCTPRKRDFLDSKSVSQPLFLVNRKQIHTEPPEARDLAGFSVTSRTPVKTQSPENDCVFEHECAPRLSSTSMFSPMKKRLRKRKLEPWGFDNVSSSTREICSEVISQPLCEDDTHNNTYMEDLVHARGRSDVNQFIHEPMVPTPRATAKNRCSVIMEKVPPMSPAKMFAYMKERGSKSEQQEVHNVSSSTRDLFGKGNIRLSRDMPLSTVHSMGEKEDSDLTSVPESVVPDNKSRMEPADSQSDTDPSEDVLTPAAPSQPLLVEDPLILNSPRISIPKKDMTVFKSNKWPQTTKFPSESVIHLQKWFLRRNPKGLFVDGIHRENSIPWNSNIIMDRISNYVLKTVSGRVYILVGKMNLHVDSEFPKWLLKKFVNGFPPNWKALYEKFLLESREETKRKSEGRSIMAKTNSEASSINLSVKRNMKKPLKTPDSCPPASSSSAKVSRSGRIIKPPLEYWKGGRVILDAYMNVTIHECYDTSICNPVSPAHEVTTTVSTRASQKPAHMFLPCSEGRKQGESASVDEASVLRRKVKAPARRRDRTRVNPEEKSSFSPVPTVETCSSPEEWSGTRTRSSQRYPATERALHMETVPLKPQSEPEKPSTRRSKEQRCDTTRPSVRASRSKRAVPESPTVNDKTSPDQSSNSDLVVRRKKRAKGGNRNVAEKSQQSRLSEESGKELRKGTSVTKNKDPVQTKHKQSKCTKTSQPAKLLPKTQSSKKHKADQGNTQIPQEQDEDEWTEAELAKLREAVALCPKHITGYWAKVARIVGTRSAEECCNQHTSQGTSQSPDKRTKKSRKKKREAPKDSDQPVISARVGTLKRKQQVRQFLENMPREDVDDLFSSAYMQNKRFEIPSVCLSEDHDFAMSDLEPMTPMSTGFPKVKTPQCLHITPGMMGSPNRSNDDKYVFQLQKRMKKSEFDVCKKAATSKSFTPTPSVKRTMRRCGNTENDTFVVWEMFPGNDGALSESGEEEDYYFSDND
uniref:mis18-binding protein 1 isoform X2 n=1 Tax=Scatophagus argus TaxID=75038 RepID=UPI001ED8215D|nr:mis18-binding protein 1 isoform X2 [Scatophagus argus]